jgi:predicted transcriptional regulator
MLKLEHFLPKSGPKASAVLLNDRFTIKALMRSPVISARPDDAIGDAAARMVGHAIHALPVVDDGNHLIGIITTSDIMHALLHGIGQKQSAGQQGPQRKPSEAEMRRAVEAAVAATQKGNDADGVAAAMLYLQARNALLETLREDITRYLSAGQDEHLHARLLKDLDRLGQASPELLI